MQITKSRFTNGLIVQAETPFEIQYLKDFRGSRQTLKITEFDEEKGFYLLGSVREATAAKRAAHVAAKAAKLEAHRVSKATKIKAHKISRATRRKLK